MEREGRPTSLDEVFTYTEIIDQVTPPRSIHWAQQSVATEAEELRFEDPEYDMESFKKEFADVFISWAKVARSAGIPLVDVIDAIFQKTNVVYDLGTRTNELDGNGRTWDDNYRMNKKRDKIEGSR